MPIYALGEQEPVIDPSAFIHPDAVVIGSVIIGAESTVWPGAVLRGDRGTIVIGDSTSIQDGTVVHCNSMRDTLVGSRCVVGHIVHLEGCTIEDDCLIGSGSTVLHGAVVRRGSLVGAGAVVPPGLEVPSDARALGVPARIHPGGVDREHIAHAVRAYVENGHWYSGSLRRLSP